MVIQLTSRHRDTLIVSLTVLLFPYVPPGHSGEMRSDEI